MTNNVVFSDIQKSYFPMTIGPDTIQNEVTKITSTAWNDFEELFIFGQVIDSSCAMIQEIDGAGTKWAPVKGTRKYNKDAFIVIKNRDRDPIVPSKAPE